jgi:hypothetical protein
MPKDNIDYSNTIIYKIYCKEANITDTYVGHTTNFIKRKYQHKHQCNNLNNKLKIYNVIRENGGWNNWDMIEIAKYNCNDITEARIKEQKHYEELKSSLNSYPPFINKTPFFCEKCNYKCSKNSEFNKHVLTIKHKTLQDAICESNNKTYKCDCGKIYKHASSLYSHKNNCKFSQEEKTDTKELINYLIKENSDFKQLLIDQNKYMIELAKNSGNYNINNNSHNKTFNLQFFLNETCKDAMNIMDFVDSLQLQLSDLEKVGELGYIEGISSIIVKNLNALDVTLRPIHCTDKKRETMYIKDEDKWEKEDANKVKMHKMVRKVANKNIHLIQDFKEKYPDCIKSSSRHSDKYNKIIVESMGGTGDNEFEKEEKIIKKVAKEVVIDKT